MDKLVDALYSRFLLRDLFGKIVPGWIALLAFPGLSNTFLSPVASGFESATQTVLEAGLAWLVAFALQSLGEWTRFLRYQPRRYSQQEARYGLRLRFDHRASEAEKQQVERYVVIKEASGIGSLSFLMVATSQVFSLIAALVRSEPVADHLGAVVLCAGTGLLLRRAHLEHADRQYDYMDAVLRPDGRAGERAEETAG